MWFATFLVCLGVGYVLKRIIGYRSNLPPGPCNIPLLGNWEFIKLWLTNGSLTEMYERLGKKYGPIIFMRTVLDAPVVAVRRYDTLKESAKDIHLNGVAVPYLYQLMNGWSNYGLSFSDGPRWQQNKKFTIATLGKLGFTRQRITALAANECSNAADKLLALKGEPVNIENHLFGAITNIVMEVLMSRQFEIDDPLFKQLREDGFELFCIAAKLKTPYDFVPFLKYFAGKNSDFQTLKRIMERFYVFCDQVIEDHESSLNVDEPEDFVATYLAAMKKANGSRDMSKADLRVLLKDLIIGGMEGPSVGLAWLLLLIAEHTDIQDKIVAEIDEIIGTDRTPSLEDERACKYTRAVVTETYRYVTITPIHRHSSSQGATLKGYHIPAGSIILEDIISVNHDKAVFGDPEVFRPERFLGPEGEELKKHEATFGYGHRYCPGTTYNYTVMFLFTAGLLQKLKFRLPDGAPAQSQGGRYNVGVRPSQPMLVALPR